MQTPALIAVGLMFVVAFVLLYRRAGRRERAEAEQLAALRRELATADPARAREIRTILRRHGRKRAQIRREDEACRVGMDD